MFIIYIYFYDFMIFKFKQVRRHLMQIVTQELAYCITWFLCCQISVKKYEIFTSNRKIIDLSCFTMQIYSTKSNHS